MKKKQGLGSFFAIILILIGLSFFLPISINFNIIFLLIVLDVLALINSIVYKEYIKTAYLIGIFIILLNNTKYLNIIFLENTNMLISIIGLTFVYLGVKYLAGK